MKKIILGTVVALTTIVLLAGCSSSRADNSSSSANISAVDEGVPTFTGVLVEAAAKQENGAIRLSLEEVKAVNDPENMLASFNGGVILNVQEEHFVADFSAQSYAAGQMVKFSLKETPIMTMSLPPQIPGNSIEQVEVLADPAKS